MTIRPATLHDVPAMVAMGERFNASTSYAQQFPWAPDALGGLATALIGSNDALVLVAEHGGLVVGMIGAQAFTHPMSGERTVAELFWWVEPEHRGGGIRLMKQAEAWARKQGASRMFMVAPQGSDVGRLYTRMGYQPIETSYQRSL